MHSSARKSFFALAAALAFTSAGCAESSIVPAGARGAAPRQLDGGGQVTPWIPQARSTFAIQYGGRLDLNVKAAIYDVDGFDTKAATVATLHRSDRHAVCYISAGTWENWRPDAGKFPKSVIGHKDGHWPGERWLDIRQLSVLEPIMSARFAMCKAKGFDAVDPDNIDGYHNRTGFPLTAAEQLAYDTWIAQEVHRNGLSVAQKNDAEQIAELRKSFDWAVVEQCYAQHLCGRYAPYSDAGRLVVDIEYGVSKSRFINDACPLTQGYGETALLKHLNLDAWVVTCAN